MTVNTAKPRQPAGLKPLGRRLWKAITVEFELSDHELALLEESCHLRDRIAAGGDEDLLHDLTDCEPLGYAPFCMGCI